MQTLGIVGGIGPESTQLYYRTLTQGGLEATGAYPEILILSIDMRRMNALTEAGDWEGLRAFLLGKVERLARAGAEVAALASNTPHIVFEALRAAAPIPMVSIIEATAAACRAAGKRELLLLGTQTTMRGPAYTEVFTREGLGVISPSPEAQREVHRIIFEELQFGRVEPASVAWVGALIDEIEAAEGIDGALLACTELPLLLESHRVPLFDTARIHCEALLVEMLRG